MRESVKEKRIRVVGLQLLKSFDLNNFFTFFKNTYFQKREYRITEKTPTKCAFIIHSFIYILNFYTIEEIFSKVKQISWTISL